MYIKNLFVLTIEAKAFKFTLELSFDDGSLGLVHTILKELCMGFICNKYHLPLKPVITHIMESEYQDIMMDAFVLFL